MPPKTEETTKKAETKQPAPLCGIRSPGPKYKCKSLVGYYDHCISKYRNPAYSIGRRQIGTEICEGPGPKYMVIQPKHPGFTFGYAAKSFDTSCGPGPKYLVPDPPKGPAFSIRWRTGYRKGQQTPGPYNIKSIPGPGISIGIRGKDTRCDGGPGPYAPYDVSLVKPRAPLFSIGFRQTGKLVCDSPGPKYNPKISKSSPMFSFGMKHSECAPPYILECDEQC